MNQTISFLNQKEVIQKCKQNDYSAQIEVYNSYKNLLYNSCFKILQRREDAEDMVQDAFIKGFQKVGQVKDDVNLAAWFRRIAINLCFDKLRKDKNIFLLDDSKEIEAEFIETEFDEAEEFSVDIIKECINKLKEKYRVILVLYLIEDYNHREISEILKINESTVRNQYARGKGQLIELFKNIQIMNLKEHIQQHKNEFDSEEMSTKSEVLFKEKLQKELHSVKKTKVVYLRFIAVAASIVLVFSVILWNQDSEVSVKTAEVLNYLEDASAGKRLEGVYKFDEEFKNEDSKIIETLLKILHKDENANVKIATVDALLKFPSNDSVRINLITALENEKTPLVQIKIIKSLSFLRENRAQKTLEEIINNEETFPIVKSNATLAMNQLKQ